MNRRRSPALRVLLITWVALVAGGVLWALATPIGGSPDEPAHLVKAASVVRGELVGTPTPHGHEVTVPRYIGWSHAWTCYAFNDEQPADCVPPMPGSPADPVTSVTMAGLYNPVYYVLVGWPSLLFSDDMGIYAMRIVSTVISTFFLAAAFALVSTWRRPALPLAALGVFVTPFVWFLLAALNPNALEATTTVAVFAAMYTLLREEHRRSTVAVLVAAACLGVTTRGLSPLWVALALLVPLLLVSRREAFAFLRRRDVLIGAAVILVVTCASLAWTVGSNSLTAGATDPDIHIIYPGAGASPIAGFFYVLVRTFEYGGQMIGLFGWMDTSAPAVVYFAYSALIAVTLAAAAIMLRGRRLAQFVVLVSAFVLLPAVIQAAYVTAGGYIWQGRYSLALFGMLLLGAGALLADVIPVRGSQTFRRASWIAAVTMAACHLVAFVMVLKRYAVGAAGGWKAFLLDPAWAPPLGPLALIVLFGLTCVGAGILSVRSLSRTAERQQVDADTHERADRETEHDPL